MTDDFFSVTSLIFSSRYGRKAETNATVLVNCAPDRSNGVRSGANRQFYPMSFCPRNSVSLTWPLSYTVGMPGIHIFLPTLTVSSFTPHSLKHNFYPLLWRIRLPSTHILHPPSSLFPHRFFSQRVSKNIPIRSLSFSQLRPSLLSLITLSNLVVSHVHVLTFTFLRL